MIGATSRVLSILVVLQGNSLAVPAAAFDPQADCGSNVGAPAWTAGRALGD
jgi:hypothetical protein